MARNSWPSVKTINSWRFWIWKKDTLLNLINHEPDIGKIDLYAKDPIEAKYQLLINKKEKYGLKVFKQFNGFYWILKWHGQYL